LIADELTNSVAERKVLHRLMQHFFFTLVIRLRARRHRFASDELSQQRSRKLYEDIVAFDFNNKRLLAYLWCQAVCSGFDVVLPAVPRTGDDRPVERPFTKRPSGVCADSVDRSDSVGRFEKGNDPAASGDFEARFYWDFVEGCDTMFFWHEDSLKGIRS
jgi:hypothetical protein